MGAACNTVFPKLSRNLATELNALVSVWSLSKMHAASLIHDLVMDLGAGLVATDYAGSPTRRSKSLNLGSERSGFQTLSRFK